MASVNFSSNPSREASIWATSQMARLAALNSRIPAMRWARARAFAVTGLPAVTNRTKAAMYSVPFAPESGSSFAPNAISSPTMAARPSRSVVQPMCRSKAR